MKYLSLLPTTCLVFLLFSKTAFAAISLEISDFEKTDNYYSLNAVVSGIASSSSCFVQAVLTAPSTPRYFGKTWGQKGGWFSYLSSPEKDFIKENFIKLENGTPLKILFDIDLEDPDYKGPGEYLVKLKRYTGDSTSSAGESNSLSFQITAPTSAPTATSTQTPTPTQATTTPTSTKTPTPTKTPTSTPTPMKAPTPTSSVSPSKTSQVISTPVIASTPAVLADSTSAAEIETTPTIYMAAAPTRNSKTPFFIGIGIAAISGGLLYFRHRKD